MDEDEFLDEHDDDEDEEPDTAPDAPDPPDSPADQREPVKTDEVPPDAL